MSLYLGTTQIKGVATGDAAVTIVEEGVKLPELTNPATADKIVSGYETIDANGEILTGSAPTQEAKTITPSTSDQTAVASGTYATGDVTVVGDADLVAGNIKSGVDIFGVTGEYVAPDDALFLNTNTMVAVLPTSASWYRVKYCHDKFIALAGGTDVAAYSTDGINWIPSTLPFSSNWYDVTYGDGKFIIGAKDVTSILISNDGINWSRGTFGIGGYDARCVCYGNGMFVALCPTSSNALYSVDGVNWEETTTSGYKYNWEAIVYGADKFVAISSYTAESALIGPVKYANYSTDGINWQRADMTTKVEWYDITYGNEKFVAVAANTDIMAYSSDGITWLTSTMPISASWRRVVYGDGKFVAVADNSNYAAYSADGITWTATTMPSSASWYGLSYGNEKFVAITNGSDIVAISTDGINWTTGTTETVINNTSGNDVTEETVQATKLLDDELATQDDLIAQIAAALEGKSVPSVPEVIKVNSITTSGDYDSSDYHGDYYAAIDASGNLLLSVIGGASTNYESIYFNCISLPSGVSLVNQTYYSYASMPAQSLYTAILRGLTTSVDIALNFNAVNTDNDFTKCEVTITSPSLPSVSIITFTIYRGNTYTYQAEEGMTWEEWVNSSYNIDGYTIGSSTYDNNHIYDKETGQEAVCEADYTEVTATDVIVANYAYETIA